MERDDDDDDDDASGADRSCLAVCRWTVLFNRRWRRRNNYHSIPSPSTPTSARLLCCGR
jgi:hypothetical protein